MKQILVIAEMLDGVIQPATWEITAAAAKIKKLKESGQIKIIIPSDDPLPIAKETAKQTGMDVIGLKSNDLKDYDSDVYKQCLFKLVKTIDPSHILTAHTSQGRDFAPGLAISFNAASIACVNEIKKDDKGLLYSRSVLGNTKNMIVRPAEGIPVVLTLMPGVFQPDNFNNQKKGRVEICEIAFDPDCSNTRRIRHEKILQKSCENKTLKGAKIIVSAGRGIGKKENLDAIFKFAQCFSSSAVGVSRPLVDMGWIGYEHQVGITGAAVSPRLYIACGISGSSQHLAGMKDARFVVSINNNPDAPIFRHSDLCIVEDIDPFLQAFLKVVQTK